MKITGWGMFWAFWILFFLVDTTLYWKGHDTFFWSHKTEAEKQHQKNQLQINKGDTR